MVSKRLLKYLLLPLLLLAAAGAYANLAPLDEDQLSQVTGQALIDSTKVQGTGVSSGITFYTMGLDAQMALNVNINHLQLGCGGINGAGACDIDINNFSLSGQPGNTTGTGSNYCPSTTTVAGCDAVFTRPSITLAISNDASPYRQVVGFELSAENLKGEMTAGYNNGTANGINALSGSFTTAATTGTTQTAADTITVTGADQIGGKATFGGCFTGCPIPILTTGGSVTVPAVTGVNFNVPAFTYYGYRSSTTNNTQASISGITSVIPNITLSNAGPISAQTQGCADLIVCNTTLSSIGLSGVIQNLNANISLTEPLGYLHVIPLNNPFYLSFEKQEVAWPNQNASTPSQTGWFMAVTDAVNLGSLSTPSGYAANISSANANIAAAFTTYLDNNPLYLSFGQVVGGVLGAHETVNAGNMNFSSYSAVAIPLSDLPLGTGQTPVPNCYGSYKFC